MNLSFKILTFEEMSESFRKADGISDRIWKIHFSTFLSSIYQNFLSLAKLALDAKNLPLSSLSIKKKIFFKKVLGKTNKKRRFNKRCQKYSHVRRKFLFLFPTLFTFFKAFWAFSNRIKRKKAKNAENCYTFWKLNFLSEEKGMSERRYS